MAACRRQSDDNFRPACRICQRTGGTGRKKNPSYRTQAGSLRIVCADRGKFTIDNMNILHWEFFAASLKAQIVIRPGDTAVVHKHMAAAIKIKPVPIVLPVIKYSNSIDPYIRRIQKRRSPGSSIEKKNPLHPNSLTP